AATYVGFYKQKTVLDDVVNGRFRHYRVTTDAILDLKEVNAKMAEAMKTSREGEEAPRRAAEKDGKGSDASSNSEARAALLQTAAQDTAPILQRVAKAMEESAKSSHLSAAEKKQFVETQADLAKYEGLLRDTVNKAATVDIYTAEMGMNEAQDVYNTIDQRLRQVLILENKLSEGQFSSAKTTFAMALVISVIVFLAALFLPLAIGLIMKSFILSPIRKTVEFIETVAEGDLTKRMEVTSRDEIGEMATHINSFVDRLHDAITHVAQSSDEVSSAAGTLDQASEKMATGIEEAAMQVNAVAAASEEMSKTSSEIAQNCVLAVKSSEQANQSAETGEEVIR